MYRPLADGIGSVFSTNGVAVMKTKIAPVSDSARRMVAQELGRSRVTDRDVEKFFSGSAVEFRDVPEKVVVMHSILTEVWQLVHRLADLGVKFAGSPQQATLVIAGTAYAAWRSSLNRNTRKHDPACGVLVVTGVSDGIEFARWNTTGTPAMHADDYATAVAGSDDPIDSLPPMEALAKVWPRWYAGGRVRLAMPQFVEAPAGDAAGWSDESWDRRPNVLTASRRELQHAKAAAQANWQKAARVSKAKPR